MVSNLATSFFSGTAVKNEANNRIHFLLKQVFFEKNPFPQMEFVS